MVMKTTLLLLLSLSSTVLAQLSCPASNNTTYTAATGSTFLVECGVDHSGGDMASSTTKTFQACVDLCSSTKGCLDVSYLGTSCYMKSKLGPAISNGVLGAKLISSGTTTTTTFVSTTITAMSASTFATTTTNAISSTSAPQAVVIAAKIAVASSVSCPSSDGASYVAQGGSTFMIECGIDHAGGDMAMVYVSSFQACVDKCSSTSNCLDVSYTGNACYMKSSLGTTQSNSNVFGAKMIFSSSSTVTPASISSVTSSSLSSSSTSSILPVSSTAALVASSLSCPASDGSTFTAASGLSYTVKCGMDGSGNDLSMQYASSLDACLTTCGMTSNCKAVSWVPGKPGPCYMKSAFVNPKSNSGVWGAFLSITSSSPSSSSTSYTTCTSSTTTTSIPSSSSNISTPVVSAPTQIPTTMVTSTISSSKLATPATSTTSSAATSPPTIPVSKNSASGCGSSLPSGFTLGGSSQMLSIVTADGLTRSYLVYIPSSYSTTSPNALVVSYHGASNTAQGQEGITGFSTNSINPDMIAVYPQGVNNYWQGAPYSAAGVDDVAFTKQMLAAMQSQFCVDANRLYATGMSNGGGFTGTLACDSSASTIFAAFGAHSGAFYPSSQYTDGASCTPSAVPIACNPGRAHVPFLEIHGNADGQIAYTGGGHNGLCLPSLPWYLNLKVSQEGYSTTNITTSLGSGNVQYAWGTSASGVVGVVKHIMVNGLGHSWASNYNGFSSSPVILSFLKQWNLNVAV